MSAPRAGPRWSLTLYVSGASPRSSEAIETTRRLCAEELPGEVELEIIDVYREPALVVNDQVLATPTLVKRLPLPLRRLIGDLADMQRVRTGLHLAPVKDRPPLDAVPPEAEP